jgi:DnaJ-class molecular chaperone
MYDLSVPNDQPGRCAKCKGSGRYGWGACVNGRMQHEGVCFSCKGTGKQSPRQIKTNHAYNRHKIAEICNADCPDPGELAEDRWNETHGDR